MNRTTPALVLVAMLALTAIAFVPTAEAKAYCTELDPTCPGNVCVWNAVSREWTCATACDPRICDVHLPDPDRLIPDPSPYFP